MRISFPTPCKAFGRSDILLKTVVFAVVVTPIAFVIGVQWGLIGLTVAWLVLMPLLFFFSMILSLPALGLRLGGLVRAMAGSAAAALIMSAVVYFARFLLEPHISGAWALVVLVATGAFTYLGSSLVLNRKGMQEVWSLAGSVVARSTVRYERE